MQLQRIRSAARARREAERSSLIDTERWRDDPGLFASQVLGITCWDRQEDVLRAITGHHRVAVRSGHKVGKSALLASAALWWACTRARAGVVLTAPTYRQVKRILWKELRALSRRSSIPLPTVPLDPGTGIQWDDGRYIVGFSTDQPENMGGFSGPEMLFLVDEASGVSEEIFEAIEGNLAGGAEDGSGAVAKLVMAGNPTRTSGAFYDAFHKHRAAWSCHHISSEDTPNAISGKVLIPGLATRHYIDERRRIWGESSPLYQIRVKGNFPSQGANAVISLAAVCSAIERWHDSSATGRLHLGVDVARYGDDESCVVARRGAHVLEVRTCHGWDEIQVSGMVLSMMIDHRIPGEQLPSVKVDTTGVGGGVATILRRDERISVTEVNAAERAMDEDMYPNVRSELWFTVAEWLADGGALPDDPELQADLVAPTYSFDARGRRAVEPKERMKARLGRSPDRADALALSIYAPQEDAFHHDGSSSDYRYQADVRGFG